MRSYMMMSLLASTCMATTPTEGTTGELASEVQVPTTGSATEAVGGELPEGFTSWEDYREKGGVAPGTDTAPAAEGEDTLPAAGAEETPKETPEEAAARTTEMVKVATEGMAPEMAEKVTPFVTAFAEKGTLTDEEVKAAATATGFTEAMVRQYMKGAEAETLENTAAASLAQAEFEKPFFETFGGADQFKAFQEWSVDGLSEAEQNAYNKALDTAPEAALELAKVYKARMEGQGAGADPTDLTNGSASAAGTDGKGFKDMAEQEAAQSDPRYRDDPEYRKSVVAKIAASTF